MFNEMDINARYALLLKALKLARTCGTYATAKFLKNRGVGLEMALLLLAHRTPKVTA